MPTPAELAQALRRQGQPPPPGQNQALAQALLPFGPAQAGPTGDQRLLDFHRGNLKNDTFLLDDQGLTTINIMGVTGPDGRIYNVPGFYDGRRISEEEAWRRAAEQGWENFPSYATGPESNKAAQQLHKQIEADGNAFMRKRGLQR